MKNFLVLIGCLILFSDLHLLAQTRKSEIGSSSRQIISLNDGSNTI